MHISHLKNVFNDDWTSDKKEKVLVLFHLSRRGGSIDKILFTICNALPKDVAKNTLVSVASFNRERSKDGIWSLMNHNGLISLNSYIKYKEEETS